MKIIGLFLSLLLILNPLLADWPAVTDNHCWQQEKASCCQQTVMDDCSQHCPHHQSALKTDLLAHDFIIASGIDAVPLILIQPDAPIAGLLRPPRV